MTNDNRLKINIGMDQSTPDAQLSTATLGIDYPTIDRDAANVLQLGIALDTVLRLLSLSVQQAAQMAPDMVPAYADLISEMQAKLSAIQPQSGGPGVIR